MDFREPQPYPPNMMMVSSNSFPNTFTPSIMMTPNTARFPLFNNNNLLPHFDPYNNNNNEINNNKNEINNDTLKPCVVASEPFKRKRGRPRKHSPPNGNTSLGLASTHVMSSSSSSIKKGKGRGRPPGSGKKQPGVLEVPVAANFTPHVLFVELGEDVAAKIMAFCEQGGRKVIILSATGIIGKVSLRHPTCAYVVTYKSHYTLMSLSGSFQNNSGRTGMSKLTVSVGGLDGTVMGGELAGKLTATSTVQVVVGSFTASQEPSIEFSNDNENCTFSEGLGLYNDNENCTFSELLGLYNNTSQPMHTLPVYDHELWAAQTH